MAKKEHSNTEALRTEFARQLSAATKDLSKKEVAEKLGISRQMLHRYLARLATPGGEVIKTACDQWNLTLSIKGFEFTGDSFSIERTAGKAQPESPQPTLFDLLGTLSSDQLEAEIVGREGDSFYLRLRIKAAA